MTFHLLLFKILPPQKERNQMVYTRHIEKKKKTIQETNQNRTRLQKSEYSVSRNSVIIVGSHHRFYS